MGALTAGLLLLASAVALSAAEAKYVGSKVCYGCHAQIFSSFQKTDMGRSMSLADEWKPNSLPAEATVTQPGGARVFSVFHNDSGWHQTETEKDIFSIERPLNYVVGSGANGLTFLVQQGNYLFQAPLSFYSKSGKWDLSPGYEKAELGFSRIVPQECINCHAGRPAPIAYKPGAFNDPPFQELAIGCENCHGPGEAHVQSAGKKAGVIVNPAKLSSRLAENICINCHQTGDARVPQPNKTLADFRPGQWLFDTVTILKRTPKTAEQWESDLLEHYSAMQASRCFQASNGKLGCLTCHDPHVQPRGDETAGYFRAKCLSCHTTQSCKFPLKARQAQTPPDNCAGCHMPKRNVMQVSHSALTNHRIPASPSEQVPPPPQATSDGLIVVNAPAGRAVKLSQVTLLRAYGQLTAKDPDFQKRYADLLNELIKTQPSDPWVQEAAGYRAFSEGQFAEAIEHLKRALPLNEPIVYRQLGEASASLGRATDAIDYLQKAGELDPYDAVVAKKLILIYIQEKRYEDARRSMQQYVEKFPDDTFMRQMLARVSR